MDAVRDYGEKVVIAVAVLVVLLLILTVAFATETNTSETSALTTIMIALETFNFRSNLGIFLLLFSLFIGVFAVYMLEFIVSLVRKEFGGAIYMAQRLRFNNHNLVVGGGRIGERIASVLKEKNQPVLIVENDELRAIELKQMGFKVLRESALDERTYKLANVQKAAAIFACLGKDVDNFIVVINSRDANKGAKIIARANAPKNVRKFREFGANEVVMPEIVGADRMVYLRERKNE